MGRKSKTKVDKRGPLQRLHDAGEREERHAPLINDFAARQGNYERAAGRSMVNRGGTPIARWKAAGLLSESQIAAINHCERLWSQLHGKALVADFNRIAGQGSGNGWSEQEALDALASIKGYVPTTYWSVFEAVCRFDEPAGTVGSRLASNGDHHIVAARLVVQFVADVIAMKERLSY